MGDTRVDLSELKQKLFLVLGSKAKLYWDSFRKFTIAKLSKKELDQVAHNLLGDENIVLHNRFVLNIFRNAYCSQPPAGTTTKKPSSSSSTKSSKPRKERRSKNHEPSPTEHRRTKKPRLTGATSGSGLPTPLPITDKAPEATPDETSSRRHRKPNLLLPAPQPRLNTFVRVRKTPASLAKLQSVTEHSLAIGTPPDLLPIRRKMLRTALETGVQDVSHDCVKYMMLALEWHLKDFLSTTLGKRKRDSEKVNPSELHAAIEINPFSLLIDRPLNQEKLISLM